MTIEMHNRKHSLIYFLGMSGFCKQKNGTTEINRAEKSMNHGPYNERTNERAKPKQTDEQTDTQTHTEKQTER